MCCHQLPSVPGSLDLNLHVFSHVRDARIELAVLFVFSFLSAFLFFNLCMASEDNIVLSTLPKDIPLELWPVQMGEHFCSHTYTELNVRWSDVGRTLLNQLLVESML